MKQLTDSEKLALFDRLVSAVQATHAYNVEIARAWMENDGRVTKTERGAVVMGNDRIEELCEAANRQVLDLAAELELEPRLNK